MMLKNETYKINLKLNINNFGDGWYFGRYLRRDNSEKKPRIYFPSLKARIGQLCRGNIGHILCDPWPKVHSRGFTDINFCHMAFYVNDRSNFAPMLCTLFVVKIELPFYICSILIKHVMCISVKITHVDFTLIFMTVQV